MSNRRKRPGMKFGKWTVLERSRCVGTNTYYKCRCECGTVREIPQGNLAAGKSSQCRRCAAKLQRTSRIDVPLRHPVSTGTIARAANVTPQCVSFHIHKYGWDGMVSRAIRKWNVNPYELAEAVAR